MSSVGLEMSMSRDFNRVDPPRRTPRNATAFPSRNVARGTRHLPPTPRPIACSHGSPRRRSALAKWDEPKHPNTTKTRRARRSQAIRERCRARASPGKSSDAPYYRTPPDSFPVPRPYLASCELRRQFGSVAEAPP